MLFEWPRVGDITVHNMSLSCLICLTIGIKQRIPPTRLSKILEYGSVRRIRDAACLSTRYKIVASVTVEVPEQPYGALIA